MRFEVVSNWDTVGNEYYNIFDTYFNQYMTHDGYWSLATAEGDCQELNDWEEQENYREYG